VIRYFVLSLLIFSGLGLVGVSLLTRQPIYAQDGKEQIDPAALRGAALYAEFCQACHGPKGEAVGSNPAFRAISSYDPNFAKGRISQGYDANPNDNIRMIGYGKDYKGPLTSIQIDDILVYMSTWAQADATPELPKPNLAPGANEVIGAGDPEHGAIIYATYCLGCHGLNAQGRGLANFPAFTINENTRRIVERGEGHGVVPAFAAAFGGPLAAGDIDDLDAYLRSIKVTDKDNQPAGVNILLIILGLAAVGGVGAAYYASERTASNKTAA
jgi:mono/diheme cytochrome c family protein